VQDVANRPSSPYNTNALFAACPNKKYSRYGNESFIIKPGMIWNNTEKTISHMQIDFDNGQGFQTVVIGTAINIAYSDTGYKKWSIKVTLNDNSVLQCYADYRVLKVSGVSARYSLGNNFVPNWQIITPINGVRGGATVSLIYSSNNFSGTIRKPLIVVEGYDIDFRAPTISNGDYDLRYFLNFELPLANTSNWNFNDQLDEIGGYDLFFVNFDDGAEDIILNAATVQEVINQVNANKVLDNRFGNIRQQNVVMGISMGGLCSRYALANMTKNFSGTPHETRLLITHDSPHRGANVPLGLQHLILMAANMNLFGNDIRDIYPDYDEFVNLLTAPATQQMLIYRATSETQATNNTFLDGAYRDMITYGSSDPTPGYRFIATSLGNECANPIFSPYTQLINADAHTYLYLFPIVSMNVRVRAESFALPNTGSTSKISYLKATSSFYLFGFIPINKTYYENTAYANGSQLPVDGIPGATNPISSELPELDRNIFIPFVGGPVGFISVNAHGTPGNFTFVPVVSALDVATFNTTTFSQKYSGGINPLYPSRSANFIAQETVQNQPTQTNNVHIRFTARNARWMFNEMENVTPNTENCSSTSACQAAGFFITGDASLCSGSKTYTFNSVHPNAPVTWSVTPGGIVSLVTNADKSVTLTKIGDGVVTLTGSATTCGVQTGNITKQITVGGPIIEFVNFTNGVTGQAHFCSSHIGNQFECFFSTPPTNTSIEYRILSWPSLNVVYTDPNSYPTGSPITVFYTPSPGWYVLEVRATNDCGTGDWVGFEVEYKDCTERGGGEWFRVQTSPNPASSDINVTIDQEKTEVKELSSSETVHYILYDFNKAKAVKQWKFLNNQKQYKLNIQGIKTGQYVLIVTKGKYRQTKQVIIQ
jgi:hypothetical protein